MILMGNEKATKYVSSPQRLYWLYSVHGLAGEYDLRKASLQAKSVEDIHI